LKKKFKDELVEKYLNLSPLIIQKYFMLVFVLFKFVFKLNITNYENQIEHKHFKLLTPMYRICRLTFRCVYIFIMNVCYITIFKLIMIFEYRCGKQSRSIIQILFFNNIIFESQKWIIKTNYYLFLVKLFTISLRHLIWFGFYFGLIQTNQENVLPFSSFS
jgi:hypothetical protein